MQSHTRTISDRADRKSSGHDGQPNEHEAYDRLEGENLRDAFRIIRSFERKAQRDESDDFAIARDNLAARLGVTGKGAAWIRDRLVELKVIVRTQEYKPNRSAARYRWLLSPVLNSETTGVNPF